MNGWKLNKGMESENIVWENLVGHTHGEPLIGLNTAIIKGGTSILITGRRTVTKTLQCPDMGFVMKWTDYHGHSA
jgi:hypothetical protein